MKTVGEVREVAEDRPTDGTRWRITPIPTTSEDDHGKDEEGEYGGDDGEGGGEMEGSDVGGGGGEEAVEVVHCVQRQFLHSLSL